MLGEPQTLSGQLYRFSMAVLVPDLATPATLGGQPAGRAGGAGHRPDDARALLEGCPGNWRSTYTGMRFCLVS